MFFPFRSSSSLLLFVSTVFHSSGSSSSSTSRVAHAHAFVPIATDPVFPNAGGSSSLLSSTTTSTTEHTVDCLVIGGGLSGSILAHNLKNAGIDVCLAEARDYLGGNVKSQRTEDGFLYEEGPHSFAAHPDMIRLAHELGISDQLVFGNESLPPWIYHNGKLHPLPKGQGRKGAQGQFDLLFGSNGIGKFVFSGKLLSLRGKLRAAMGFFLGHPSPPEGKEETIREWVTRVLGEEIFMRCMDPFVSGVYAGDPNVLSMKAAFPKMAGIEDAAYSIPWNKFGALFYGAIKRQKEAAKVRKSKTLDPNWPKFTAGNPGSFREGMGTLPNAIAEELGECVKLQWKVTSVERSNDGYVATFQTPNGIKQVNSKCLVSTVPAHTLVDALQPLIPETKTIFEKVRSDIDRVGIYHPPLAVVSLAYPESSFRNIELPNGFGSLQNLPGFGSLYPRSEGIRLLGTLWISSLFPGRAPPGYCLLANFIGGSQDPGIANMSEDEIIAEVDKGCRQVLLKEDAPKPKVLALKRFSKAIPQYEIGHNSLIEDLKKAESKLPGLWVCGNYKDGVSVPDCVSNAYERSKAVKEFLDSHSLRDSVSTTANAEDM